jgi:hypothetical protein
MPKKRERVKILRANLPEHPAFKVWRKLRSRGSKPHWIAVLKDKEKAAVYRLAGVGPAGSAIIAKQCWERTAMIERTVYEEVLPHLPLPMLRYYGFVEEADGKFCWVFLEDAGKIRYSPRVKKHRQLAGHWLGLLHTSAARLAAAAQLPERGPDHYLEHLRSARDKFGEIFGSPFLSAADRKVLTRVIARLDGLEENWGRVQRFCDTIPRTLVHGDLQVRNMRIRTGPEETVLFAVDWETAGWGVPAADLVQCAGRSLSPDLGTYRSVVRLTWPELDAQALDRLANFGKIFRSLAALHWESQTIIHAINHRKREWVKNPMYRVIVYQGWLAKALRARPGGD